MFSLKLLIFACIAFKKIFALKCNQCTEKNAYDALKNYDGINWSTTDINKALTGIGTIDTNTAGWLCEIEYLIHMNLAFESSSYN